MSSFLLLLVLLVIVVTVAWAADSSPEPLERATNCAQRRVRVRLNEFKFLPEIYRHRGDEEFKPETLELFMENLILEGGIKVAVVFFTDAQGNKTVLSGHRRVTGCKLLADRHQAGFTHDMEVDAIELLDATPQDLLVESVSDNGNRKDMSPTYRLRAIKLFHEAAVEVKRAARALGVSDQTYERDLRIVRHDWMYKYVDAGYIAPTVATAMLKQAEDKGRVKEVEEDLGAWMETKVKEQEDRKRQHKAATGKELKESDQLVKDKQLSDHWIECIKEGRRFDDNCEMSFNANIDKDGKLTIPPLSAQTKKMKGEDAVMLLGRLGWLMSKLVPIAKERVEADRFPEQVNAEPPPFDFEFLRQNGLGDQAKQLEEKYRAKLASATEGEEAPDQEDVEEPRQEPQDLASTIELPEPEASAKPTDEPAAPAPAEEKPQIEKATPQAQPAKPSKNKGKESK